MDFKTIDKFKELKNKMDDKVVHITGHKIVDVDSYISMILMSKLLTHLGIKNEPVLLIPYEEIDAETKRVIEHLSLHKLKYKPLSSKDYLFLVDHNNQKESSDGIVVGIVDHHQDEGCLVSPKIVRPAGATGMIILEIMKLLEMEINSRVKELALYSLLIDTNFLLSNKTTSVDETSALEIANDVDLNIEELKKIFFTGTDFSSSVEILASNGLKEFEINGMHVKTIYLESLSPEKDILMVDEVASYLQETKMDLGILIFYDFINKCTYVYPVKKEKPISKVLEFSYVASRGKTIMPMVRELISQGAM